MPIDPTALEREIAAAETRYRETLARLRRPDGSSVYAPAEEQEREQAARAAFHTDLAGIRDRLDAAIAAAQAELVAVAAADPTKGLSREQLERINLRTPIVAEDLTHLTEEVQLARLRAALAGDVVERFIYARVGRALTLQNAARGDALPQYRNGQPVPAELTPVGAAVRTLEDSLIDGARRQRAEQTIADAQRVAAVLGSVRYTAETYGPRPAATTRA